MDEIEKEDWPPTRIVINFVQSISALLNGNKPKDELIADPTQNGREPCEIN